MLTVSTIKHVIIIKSIINIIFTNRLTRRMSINFIQMQNIQRLKKYFRDKLTRLCKVEYGQYENKQVFVF